MLSKKQASTLRGSITHLLQAEKELAWVGSQEPSDRQAIKNNHEKAKRKVYGLIAQYTEKELSFSATKK